MGKLKLGDKAPEFVLKDKAGDAISLQDIKAKFTVLYFYPRDNTPGCTIEARSFSALKKEFEREGAHILGISGGDEKSKEKFCKKNKLSIDLLSDSDFSVAKNYGAYGKKKFMGMEFKGIFRMTFVLDKNKKVIKIFDSVKVARHAEEVLNFIMKECQGAQ